MSGVIDATNWMSEHMDDKGDRTPLPSGRPVVPDYVIEAKHKEHDAWQAYLKAINEELESEKGNPDYQRLAKTHDNWLEADIELHKAYDRWDREQKEQK